MDTAAALGPEMVHVVIGSGADEVRKACRTYEVNWVLQEDRRGTGHAVIQAMPDIPDEASVLVADFAGFTKLASRENYLGV